MAGLSGAMLLLLLASTLLLVPFCGSQQMYGNTVGSYFHFPYTHGRLRGIRFYTGGRGVNGMQMKFGDTWSNIKGGKIGKKSEFLLDEDERVIAMEGSTRDTCFSSLTIRTSRGRQATLGKDPNPQFQESAPPGKHLRSIIGIRFPLCILGLAFIWGAE